MTSTTTSTRATTAAAAAAAARALQRRAELLGRASDLLKKTLLEAREGEGEGEGEEEEEEDEEEEEEEEGEEEEEEAAFGREQHELQPPPPPPPLTPLSSPRRPSPSAESLVDALEREMRAKLVSLVGGEEAAGAPSRASSSPLPLPLLLRRPLLPTSPLLSPSTLRSTSSSMRIARYEGALRVAARRLDALSRGRGREG